MGFQRLKEHPPNIDFGTNRFHQELYEPLWDELYQRLKAKGIRIRDIFIADVAQQGASGVLNEQKLGNDRT